MLHIIDNASCTYSLASESEPYMLTVRVDSDHCELVTQKGSRTAGHRQQDEASTPGNREDEAA